MEKITQIDVCIPTFKRPLMLSALLSSLMQQELNGIAMRFIVIDNDREESARAVTEQFRQTSDIEIIYDVEPQQNIALARNRALNHVSSEYFAFVDDDESVSQQWLSSLLSSMKEYQADFVFGPVISALPENAPNWAAACFKKQWRKTGTLMEFGGAGNVLGKMSAINHPVMRFNSAFGLTGGEDTEFFYRLFLSGKRLVWCNEAWATEPVPDARLSLQWIRRRGFRGGQTYRRIFVTRYTTYQKAIWFFTKLFQLVTGILVAPIIRLVSYPSYVALTVRIAAASGQLSSCFSGENFEEYNVRRYQ
ncbi:MAG: glycosyltransferase [Burkholderiaceae bacterium]